MWYNYFLKIQLVNEIGISLQRCRHTYKISVFPVASINQISFFPSRTASHTSTTWLYNLIHLTAPLSPCHFVFNEPKIPAEYKKIIHQQKFVFTYTKHVVWYEKFWISKYHNASTLFFFFRLASIKIVQWCMWKLKADTYLKR